MVAPEPPPAGAGLRWARALLVASLAWGTSSAGHVLAGGVLPSPAFVAVLVVVTAWPVSLALRARAGGVRMIALLGAGQAAMHTALVVASWNLTERVSAPPAAGPNLHTGMPGMQMMDAGGLGVGHTMDAGGAGVVSVMDAGHAMSLLPGPVMLLAHLAAAVILGAVLADGDRFLFRLRGLLAHLSTPAQRFGQLAGYVLALLAAATGTGSVPAAAMRIGIDVPGRRLRMVILSATLGRRGPPALLAA